MGSRYVYSSAKQLLGTYIYLKYIYSCIHIHIHLQGSERLYCTSSFFPSTAMRAWKVPWQTPMGTKGALSPGKSSSAGASSKVLTLSTCDKTRYIIMSNDIYI